MTTHARRRAGIRQHTPTSLPARGPPGHGASPHNWTISKRPRWVREHHTGTSIRTLLTQGAQTVTPIIPPVYDPPRDPSDGQPFVRLDTPGHGYYEMTVKPGADPFEVARTAVRIPTDAVFIEALGTSTSSWCSARSQARPFRHPAPPTGVRAVAGCPTSPRTAGFPRRPSRSDRSSRSFVSPPFFFRSSGRRLICRGAGRVQGRRSRSRSDT